MGPPQPGAPLTIREEARALRTLAHAQGWAGIEQQLYRLELCVDQAPHAIAAELEALAQALGPAANPPQARAGPPVPRMTVRLADAAAEVRAQVAAQRPPAATPAQTPPGGPYPGAGAAPPGPAAKGPNAASSASGVGGPVLGLRGFKSGAVDAVPPAAPGPEPREGSILNLPGITAGRAAEVPRVANRTPWDTRPRSKVSRSSRSSRPPAPKPSKRGGGNWVYVASGGLVAVALGAVLFAIFPPRRPLPLSVADAGPIAIADAAPAEASAVDQLTALIHQIGSESSELHALIEAQGHLMASCRQNPSLCDRGWTRRSVEAMAPIDPIPVTPPSAGSLIPPPGMKLPHDFPFRNDPLVTGVYNYYATNIDGRQVFAGMLRECSQYGEIFDGTLRKYGAPTWLSAVVYQESGCSSRVTSPVGALGLWQFMPESARAYNLHVVEDEVDERLNPIKATDAAIHMLVDLDRKFGAWDLALAAYNMGPFALTERVAQVSHGAADAAQPGFWDLVSHELLPKETAGYVPRIEAYALLLENRNKLGFPPDGKPLESTSEVVVASGTRLSLIARAAHTSTRVIRELNPEFLRDAVPPGLRSARVPPSEVHRAQEFLDDPPADKHDACVPEDFDWGHQVFEKSPYAHACKREK